MITESYGLPTQLRLGKPAEYRKVFENPARSTDSFFTLLAIKNDYDHPRLGLAIAKKNIKKAVTRNLIKRAVRENFRQQQHQLINIDIVVLARRDAANASSDLLKKSLDKHWLRLVNRCNTYS
ncbi:MAG: ribonuclease P protein component [Methylococcales symbiont of Hymedesmia sp. n. MRB-2018]|nr:MAG: ribonuclease P protein component [Methylococcales symbiont of Hymedesmia sp. n. MRB-2018]KAF3983310.1 MAG: ribonuclease P protein component [Methylococcales symbiont of Hymedesmia sp. n. MRB-2018]